MIKNLTYTTAFLLLLLVGWPESVFSQQEPPENENVIEMDLQEHSGIQHSINRRSNVIEYPFGYSQPVLKAAQLRYSRIVLQKGEVINSILVGDPGRWHIEQSWEGPSGSTNPVVLVKPRFDDASTNLLIFTDKRTYDITIEAADVDKNTTNPNEFFTRAISFYYPNEGGGLARGNQPRHPPESETDSLDQEIQQAELALNPGAGVIDLAEISMDYTIKEGKYGFPWKPEAVYHDSKHTFIKIPKSVEAAAMPAFYLVSDGGSRQNVNIALPPNSDPNIKILKIDRVFDKGVLIYTFESKGFLGIGTVNREHELFIIRN